MKDLDSLRTRLVSTFSPGLRLRDAWWEPEAMTRVVSQIRERHDGPGMEPDMRAVAGAVAFFRRHGRPEGWRGLKHTCFGAGSPDENGWCLLSDGPLRGKLLALVQDEAEPRRRTKCFQSLLACYWSFSLATADPMGREGWKALRAWLASMLPALERGHERMPGWMPVLSAHSNLLGENPCDRYGPSLLAGDASGLRQALTGLGIPSDSWVLDEAVVSRMRAGVALGHDRFKEVLPGLLSVAMGQAGVSISMTLRTRCVAMLVSRYARCADRPENNALREAAVSVIGNPWLRRTSWDASVVDGRGNPDGGAREMINGWLKRRLITDFFQLLSADGTGDTRRLDYWLRFEPFIEDMWFALGSDARWRQGENFDDFRNRAKGRLLNLEQTTSENNAFVMRMGEHVAMEFGATGNALYVFRWEALPQAVMLKLTSGRERTVDVTIHQLKSSNNVFTKRHVDSPVALESWEQKFDAAFCPLIGHRPKVRPAFVPELETLLKVHSIDGEDKRPQGGALWIYADNSHSAFSSRMTNFGFSYRSGNGWYRE